MTNLASIPDTIEQEVANFEVEDLFMSRTDERGVIQSGNEVFRRLAGYEWSELIGAPHKVIRHPDMPKAIFRLFWDRLKASQQVGAFVKNRVKGGGYYWVFAIVIPVDNGYVSVRLKPSTTHFDEAKGLYLELLEAERNGESPEDCQHMIDAFLAKHGWSSYDAAMSVWVHAEVAARRGMLNRKSDPILDGLQDLKSGVVRIGKELDAVRVTFESIRGTPTNLRIQATRFGDKAITIQIISQNYDMLTKEIEAANATMSKIYDSLVQILDEDSFGLSAVTLLYEAYERFKTETDLPENASMEEEARIVQPYTKRFTARADLMLKRTEELVLQVRQLQRIVSGLAVTRVMCRIEEAGLMGDSGGIADIVTRLLEFQTTVMASIEHIDGECRDAHRAMSRLAASFASLPMEPQAPGGGDPNRALPDAESAVNSAA